MSRGRTCNIIRERIDGCVVNDAWINCFPQVRLENLYAFVFDHSPIILFCNRREVSLRAKRFKFENALLLNPDIEDIVWRNWRGIHGRNILHSIKE